jgi:hypothetical protein
MWPRAVEVMLAVWLAASPFVFRHPFDRPSWWWNDLGVALFVATVSLWSCGGRTIRAHLLNVVAAVWLVAFGYVGAGDHPPPAAQNAIVVGLVLLMVALIPSEANLPPKERRGT